MSKKVIALLKKHGPMLSGKLARIFENEYGVSNMAARQALSRAKSPVNKICTLSFEKNQKFFYLENQFMSQQYVDRLLEDVKGHKLHERVLDDLIKCHIIEDYDDTRWKLSDWVSDTLQNLSRSTGIEVVKKQIVNDFASWAGNINLVGYGSSKTIFESAEFANFQWAFTAPSYVQPLYNMEAQKNGFVVADVFYGRTATLEDIQFFINKISIIRSYKKLPCFLPVLLIDNAAPEALKALKEHKVMVAFIKNLFDKRYVELLAEIFLRHCGNIRCG